MNKSTMADQQPYDPACYLCPGNPRTNGDVNPKYPGVFAFDNDFPALLPPSSTDLPAEHNGLLIAEPENGRCRVLCFHPNHSLTLSQMALHDIQAVINVWVHETQILGSDPYIKYVQIFENRGAMMGSSNPHPHCQIWATGHIPEEPAAEAEAQLAHYNQHQRTLLADYLTQELEQKVRIVSENDTFVAVVPFWAVWPFETLIIPRDPIGSFTDLSLKQAAGLAEILKRVTTRYDNLFGVSFPYTMGFHQAPTDGQPHPEIHFHAHFYPPLLRSAEIRKFMVGFEMLGMPQRDITPEKAAEMLRAVAEL